ncbi:MAG: hypothetical protein HY423_02645 [Candidatus Lambdaproteobacteria bacterium]|nr:hypothetical protein [Candidatus Lambdaproteobacteria bacterium]
MTSESRSSPVGLLAALGVALAGALALGGCSFGKVTVDKAEYQKVKTVAVVIYTVPESIEYKDDPREKKKSLLQQVIQAVAKGDGVKAATVSQASFSEALNRQGLPFRVLSADEVRSNPGYSSLNMSSYVKPKEQPAGGATMQLAMSFMGAKSGPPDGSAPQGLVQFGLPQDWSGGNPLMGTKDETRYLTDTIKALGVDAALVVADPGYAFVCNACAGGTGDGSTGSAFMVSLVNPQGKPILAMREWFATSGGHAAMVAYAVNPLQHESLYKQHGEYMAKVFGDIIKAEVK